MGRIPTPGSGTPRFGILLAAIAGFLAVGVPLVALVWHNLNHLLSGDLRWGPALILVLSAAGLTAVVVVLGRMISRWDTRET